MDQSPGKGDRFVDHGVSHGVGITNTLSAPGRGGPVPRRIAKSLGIAHQRCRMKKGKFFRSNREVLCAKHEATHRLE